MTELVAKIAEVPVKITTEYPEIKSFFKEYLSDEPPFFAVKADSEDIQSEIIAIHELISEKMPAYDAFLFHASAISCKGDGILFAAVSGTGKSTHAGYWSEQIEGVSYINDDKPFIRIRDGKAYVYGSPWMGKHVKGANSSAEIKALCVLERDGNTSVSKVDSMDVYPLILQQTYRPKDRKMLEKTLSLLDIMLKASQCFLLRCANDPKAAIIARNGIYEIK